MVNENRNSSASPDFRPSEHFPRVASFEGLGFLAGPMTFNLNAVDTASLQLCQYRIGRPLYLIALQPFNVADPFPFSYPVGAGV